MEKCLWIKDGFLLGVCRFYLGCIFGSRLLISVANIFPAIGQASDFQSLT